MARTLSDIGERLVQLEESLDKTNQDLVEVSEKADEDIKTLSGHTNTQQKEMLQRLDVRIGQFISAASENSEQLAQKRDEAQAITPKTDKEQIFAVLEAPSN